MKVTKGRAGAGNGTAAGGRRASTVRTGRLAPAPSRPTPTPTADAAKSPPRVVIVNAQQLLALVVTLLALYWASRVRVHKAAVEKPPDATWWSTLAALPATFGRLLPDGALRGTLTVRGGDVLWVSVVLGLVVAFDAALVAYKQYRRRTEGAEHAAGDQSHSARARVEHEQRAANDADTACAQAPSRHLPSTAGGGTASRGRASATPRESSCKTTQASASIRTARSAYDDAKPTYCLCTGCVQSVRGNELAKVRSQLSSLVTAISDNAVPDALVDSSVRRELRNWRLWRVLLGDAPYSALSERDAQLFVQSVSGGGDCAPSDRCLRCEKPLDAARLRAVDTRSNVRY